MKYKYLEKVVIWKKKPNWGDIILSVITILGGYAMIIAFILRGKDMVDGFILGMLPFFVLVMILVLSESLGEGRKVVYRRVK